MERENYFTSERLKQNFYLQQIDCINDNSELNYFEC